VTLDKAEARRTALAARDEAHDPERDRFAQARLRTALAPLAGRPIAGFLPIGTEIDPLPIMAELATEGPVGVPITPSLGHPLTFRAWTPETPLIDGKFGTRWPAEGDEVVPEVLIVPLVGFDRAGNRLGYGGGFYDRTLEALRAVRPTVAVGYAYAAQELDELPLEPTDQPLDAIVTEAETLRFT
jgi:5-formyltetrahydrofolate cyclo-ligase